MDHRYIGQIMRELYNGCFNEHDKTITVRWEDENGLEASFPLPARYEVCDTCNGDGKHVDPNIDSQGLTAEDFAEDPYFEEGYRAGIYNVHCYQCSGARVVPRVDEERVAQGSEEAKQALKHWHEFLKAQDSYRRESESERRYGA